MALPYLAASLVPAVARWLPRPGAWMETFRRLMAFPLFATVAWLVWVLGQQSGIDGAGALLALLVALSMVVWALTLLPRPHARGAGPRWPLAGLARSLAWSAGAAITRQQGRAVFRPRWPAAGRGLGAGPRRPVLLSHLASRCSSTSRPPGA